MEVVRDTPKIYRYYSSHEEPTRVTVIGSYADRVLKVAVARCSEQDNFSRKKARQIAEGRLNKGLIYSIVNDVDVLKTEDFIKIAKLIKEMVNTNSGTQSKPVHELKPTEPYVILTKKDGKSTN